MISAITTLEAFLIANFDYTNKPIAGLSANPSIRLESDEDPTSKPTDGEIILDLERMVRETVEGVIRRQEYEVTASVILENDRTTLQEILEEVDRIFIANNKSPTRTNQYYFSTNWDTNIIEGVVAISFQIFTNWAII